MKRAKKEKRPVAQESDELRDQLARALADYDNLQKRVEKERQEIVKIAGIALFERLLPIFDILSKAQRHLKDDGLNHAMNELKKALEEEGIVKIKAEAGQKFDENIHEAIEAEEAKEEELKGTIAEVIFDGWMVREGPIIRPAKVRVYSDKIEKKKELEEEMARGGYT